MLFGNPNIRYFNELEINGENVDDEDDKDYTKDELDDDETTEDDEEVVNDEAEDDDLTDFTEDEFDDEDPDDEGEDTEEEPVDDEGGDDDDELEDYTQDTTEDVEDEETADDNAGGDEDDNITDFTQDTFDDEDGEDAGVDEGEDTGEESTDDSTDEGSDDAGEAESNDTDNTLAGMEKNLFSDLSPQQMSIKNNELLQNYIELYETISTVFDSINKIPKTINNTRPLTFIADQLVELKDMVNYVITTTYVTRTYVENMAYYKQALVVLEQLNTMLKALIQKPAK